MHVHKPKPVHGLREFLSEILVIVVGIAIALGGEQAIEWLHWRHVGAETRAALRRELALDSGRAQVRLDESPCMARRLAELRTIFRRHAAGQPVRMVRPFGWPNFTYLDSAIWETAVADQSISHMPPAVRRRYASAYGNIAWLRDKQNQEAQIWARLSLIDQPEILTEADWSALHQAEAEAETLESKVDLTLRSRASAGRAFADADGSLGVTPTPFHFPAAEAEVAEFCKPLLE